MRRIAPTIVLVLAAVLAGAVPASGRGGGVRIQKIVFDPPGADNGSNASLNKETVTIVNGGSSAVVLTGWTLRDRDRHIFRFPAFTLGGGAKVTIHNGTGSNNARNLYWGSSSYVWNNDGDTATLKRGNGSTVDRCTYSGSGNAANC